MPKTLIFPIVAVVAMVAKLVFGVEITEQEQVVIVENVATVAIAVTALYSIVKNIVKRVQENKKGNVE